MIIECRMTTFKVVSVHIFTDCLPCFSDIVILGQIQESTLNGDVCNVTILFFLHDCTGIKTLVFLPFNQFRKETSCFTQRLVGAIFNNVPFIQNDNPITFFDCGQSMCNHNSCTF